MDHNPTQLVFNNDFLRQYIISWYVDNDGDRAIYTNNKYAFIYRENDLKYKHKLHSICRSGNQYVYNKYINDEVKLYGGVEKYTFNNFSNVFIGSNLNEPMHYKKNINLAYIALLNENTEFLEYLIKDNYPACYGCLLWAAIANLKYRTFAYLCRQDPILILNYHKKHYFNEFIKQLFNNNKLIKEYNLNEFINRFDDIHNKHISNISITIILRQRPSCAIPFKELLDKYWEIYPEKFDHEINETILLEIN